jgi:AcrR family transcriptional regulator
VTSRHDHLLDAAITVLGESGMHRLTHRTVDAVAGLPAGSCSNLFRTREALIHAVVERIADREMAFWYDIASRTSPITPRELAEAAVRVAQASAGPGRTLALARHAILLEAAVQPALRPQLLLVGGQIRTWFLNWLRTAGSTDPERDGPIIMNYLSGLLLHELANPDPAFDPTDDLTRLVTTLIRPRDAEVPT